MSSGLRMDLTELLLPGVGLFLWLLTFNPIFSWKRNLCMFVNVFITLPFRV